MPEPRRDEGHPRLIEIAPGAAMPVALAPMRPRLALDAFNSPDWLFELKWDGIRALAIGREDGVRVVDRYGGDLLPLVPELREVRLPAGTMLDGEVVVVDGRGRPSYELLAARAGPKALRRGRGPYFVAFDLLYAGGRALLAMPLHERRARLLAGPYGGRRVFVPEHLERDGEPFFEVVAEYGLEGIVAKRRDGRYVPGAHTLDWLKYHVTPRADVVLGALIGDDRRGATSALVGYTAEAGRLAYAGEALVPPFLAHWLDDATRDLTAPGSAFTSPIPLRPGLRWLRPKLVAIVEHGGSDVRMLGDARFRQIRFDARPDDCRPEEPVAVPSGPPSGRVERPRLVLMQSLPLD
ncbi:MAG TPA: hypothetical protein VFM93_11455 [Candidatus Limnocylindria bacterium]|nr:hypothetical protein [Candidatus Limnocylindria bacterium]